VENKWVLEYSVSQDCFNVDTKENILEKNINAMYTKMSNDYKIIGEFNTQEIALEAARKLRERISNED
jgi:hypothetical protein